LAEIKSELENKTVLDNYQLLGMEGNASKIYFKAYFEDIGWNSRKPRTKIDELNTLLDIGYTFLFSFIEAHLKIYGFDVYYGFYHRLFYQRKSLVCDMMEPFRCLIDKAIRDAFHLKKFNKDDFIKRNEQYILRIDKNKKYTGVLFENIIERKNDIFEYIREYYRFEMQERPMDKFPVFELDRSC
jgi:CRISPR-associated protein Cas1